MICLRDNCAIRTHDHSNDKNIIKFFNLPEKYEVDKTSIIRDEIYIQMYKMLYGDKINQILCVSILRNLLTEFEYSEKINNKELYAIIIYKFLETPMCSKFIKSHQKFREVACNTYNGILNSKHLSQEFYEHFKTLNVE